MNLPGLPWEGFVNSAMIRSSFCPTFASIASMAFLTVSRVVLAVEGVIVNVITEKSRINETLTGDRILASIEVKVHFCNRWQPLFFQTSEFA